MILQADISNLRSLLRTLRFPVLFSFRKICGLGIERANRFTIDIDVDEISFQGYYHCPTGSLKGVGGLQIEQLSIRAIQRTIGHGIAVKEHEVSHLQVERLAVGPCCQKIQFIADV